MRWFCIVMFLGCGGGDGTTPDPPDAPVDDCPGCGPLAVTTFEHVFPVRDLAAPRIPIVSLREGEVIAEGSTDADGKATIEVAPGGSVLAIYRYEGGAEIVMYAGVQPGEALEFGAQSQPVTGGSQMTATFPELAGTDRYVVASPCTNFVAQTSTSVTFPTCDASPMNLLFLASRPDQPFPPVHGWALLENVAVVPDGTTGITEWNPTTTATFSITNATGFVIMNLEGDFGTGTTFLAQLTSGSGVGCNPVAGECTGTSPWVGAPARITGTANLIGSAQIFTEVDTSPTSPTFALEVPPLPPSVMVTSNTGSAITWTLDTTDTAPFDAIRTQFRWNGEGFTTIDWAIYVSPTSTSAAIPALPAAYADVLPTPADVVEVFPEVIDVRDVTGYDELRALSERAVDCIGCALRSGRITGAITR